MSPPNNRVTPMGASLTEQIASEVQMRHRLVDTIATLSNARRAEVWEEFNALVQQNTALREALQACVEQIRGLDPTGCDPRQPHGGRIAFATALLPCPTPEGA